MRLLVLLSLILLLVASCEEKPFSTINQLPNHPSITIVTDFSDSIVDTVVIEPSPYVINIEIKEGVLQGGFVNIAIEATTSPADMGGYNFLIGYDASVLTFQGANPGPVLGICEWEYFTYRFGADGNCDGQCPSGLVRLVAIAETNNGATHPVANCDTEGVLASLKFLVTNDRNFEGAWVPIRFFWIDCRNNTIYDVDGDSLFYAQNVMAYNHESNRFYNLTNLYPDSTLPTYVGPTSECDTTDEPKVTRAIDFYNGGIEILGYYDVDDTGDLNLDGLAYTIADAVMFSNYFMEDTLALVNIDVPNQYGEITGYTGSIEASDVNKDSIPLQVADMVFLIQVINGNYDNFPIQLNTVDAYLIESDNGVLSIDKEMGAVFMKFAGETTPTLLADNMEMKSWFDGVDTRVLVWSMEGNYFSGDFLQADAELAYIEMATKEAYLVNIKLSPDEFLLEQNRPNPFRTKTDIRFGLAERAECKIIIRQVNNAKIVASYQAEFEAGYTIIRWNAAYVSSGDYEFELTVGDLNKSIVMTLE